MTDVKQQENTVTAVSLQGVSHTYGQVRALNNIHLSIPKSVTVGLIGPDGVGKSTLLSLIAGVKVIQSGQVLIFDQDISQKKNPETFVTAYRFYAPRFGAQFISHIVCL